MSSSDASIELSLRPRKRQVNKNWKRSKAKIAGESGFGKYK